MACAHLSFDIVHRLGRSTDLPRYCNYIIGQFLLSCILIQVLEASPTPLIAWNLSSPLHDKCIWTQSVCNGFLLRERYGARAKADQKVHTHTYTHAIFSVGQQERCRAFVWKRQMRAELVVLLVIRLNISD